MIALKQYYTQSPGNVVSDMNGDTVMFHIEKGKYYNLGEIGGAIWNALEKEVTAEEIVSQLQLSYEVDQETCRREVESFLKTLEAEDLLIVKEIQG